MTETTNYKLKKPGDSDNVRVDVLNGNMDVIDRELKQRATLDENGKLVHVLVELSRSYVSPSILP